MVCTMEKVHSNTQMEMNMDGDWVKGCKHGKGVMRYADGTILEQEFHHES